MAEKILLLSCDPWHMTDEKTGERRTGVSLSYLSAYRDEAGKGLKPIKVSAPAGFEASIGAVALPAFAEVDFTTRPGAGGKATIAVSAIKIGKPLNIDALFKSAA